MSVYRQYGKWWYEFEFQGRRIRKSSRSSDRNLAKLIEAEHRRSLETGSGDISPTLQALKAEEKAELQGVEIPGSPEESEGTVGPEYCARPIPTPEMCLREAGDLYIKNRRDRQRARTLECDVTALRNLLRFFGDMRLSEFHIGHIEQYQKLRGKEAGPSTINHGINFLSRLLKQAKLWGPIKEHYHPLKEAAWRPPKIFSADEQTRIFSRLEGDPELELAQIVFTITRNTTASGCELRGLRFRNLELEAEPPRIHIPPEATKNNIRPRTIPLNRDALLAFKRAVARAARLGCRYPEHYLFPLRVNRALYDPTKPASKSWLRKQVEQVRKKTGIEHLNPHVFRHLAVTELLEQGAPEQTVIALAGWVGRKMIETYSHARIEAKADVVKLLDRSGHKAPAQPKKKRRVRPKSHPAPVPQLPADLMHPAIQAEIARQVALALQERAARTEGIQEERVTLYSPTRANMITFPGTAQR